MLSPFDPTNRQRHEPTEACTDCGAPPEYCDCVVLHLERISPPQFWCYDASQASNEFTYGFVEAN